MRKLVTLAAAPLLALLAAYAAPAAAAPVVHLPAYHRQVLPNGLTLLVLPDHRLPLVEMQLLVRAGSGDDPPGMGGLSDLTATLLRRGTTTRSARQVAEEIDFLGASLDAGADRDRTVFDMEILARNLEPSLALFADVLLHPAFDTTEFARAKAEALGRIEQRRDQPGDLANIEFVQELFGAHPYAHALDGSAETVSRLGVEDAKAYYRARYVPANCILAVVGDVEPLQIEHALTAALGGWSGPPPVPAAPPEAPHAPAAPRIVLVDKPDAVQSEIRLGCLGAPRGSPDYYALRVLDALLGGEYTSRLVTEIRVRRGLSYSPTSRENFYQGAGAAYLSMNTANKTTLETLKLALGILADLRAKPVSDDELARAKSFTTGQFPLELERPENLAAQLAAIEFFGLDPRFVDTFGSRIEAVTAADVQRVARQYFGENFLLLVVGRRAEIEEGLRTLGPVEVKGM